MTCLCGCGSSFAAPFVVCVWDTVRTSGVPVIWGVEAMLRPTSVGRVESLGVHYVRTKLQSGGTACCNVGQIATDMTDVMSALTCPSRTPLCPHNC